MNGWKVLLGTAVVVVPATAALLWFQGRRGSEAKKQTKQEARPAARTRKVRILYGTVTGTARNFAKDLLGKISALGSANLEVSVVDLADYNEDDLEKEDIVLLISSTWTDGTAPEKSQMFFEHLKDFAYDFRVSKDHLSKLSFSCFGLGSAYYGDNYAKPVLEAHGYLEHLGAKALAPVARGDDQTDLEDRFVEWADKMVILLAELADGETIEAGDERLLSVRNSGKNGNQPAHKNPILTDEEKAELLKQRKQSKMKVQNKPRTARASSFQKQQLALGIGKSGTSNKNKKDGDDSSSVASSEQYGASKEEKGDEDEEEEEDRINNTFVDVDDIDVQDVKDSSTCCGGSSKDDSGSSSCCNSNSSSSSSSCGDGKDKGKATNPNLLPPIDDDDDEDEEEAMHQKEKDGTLDVEDLGASIKISQERSTKGLDKEPAAMVTKLQRKSLTKEGYRIIGTHSAVKLCRWTKNQMRGRGGCYKHTFYGITSYQCMEATPSLACASKCVFCWRHHKNPVGTEWRWKQDDPSFIVNEAVELHRSMINEMRGVPGVKQERLEEGYQVKHCALSLVGEPIMYPRINEMLQELHNRQISSFMVTNAQFPEEVRALDPVTQLYVSVDAATRDSLKAIDRPLFKDFWERFQGALTNMKHKQQRTVYRLTLVSGWNMTEVDAYAQLVEEGEPDFIEIKAVTYCGKSDGSSLTMENVPWHK